MSKTTKRHQGSRLSLADFFKIVLSYKLARWNKTLPAGYELSLKEILVLLREEARIGVVYLRARIVHVLNRIAPFR